MSHRDATAHAAKAHAATPRRSAGRRAGLAMAAAMLGGAWLGAAPALAHPHVWVSTRAELVYSPQGTITAVRHAWTFDETYTAFLVQGLDTNGDGRFDREELAELAKVNTDSLAEVDFFTFAKAAGAKVIFGKPQDAWLTHDGKQATLNFTLPLGAPVDARKPMTLEVYDPTFFVAFSIDESADAVRTAGAAPGCKLDVRRPQKLELGQAQQLSESFFSTLSADANFGARFANRILAVCP
jgi:ABC-type uncharacterized transport system substrate-binding protein